MVSALTGGRSSTTDTTLPAFSTMISLMPPPLSYAASGANGGSTPAGSGNSWALSVIATIV